MDGFEFQGKRVLVAGGTGLIGIPLVRRLIEHEGARVRIASLDDPSRAHPDAQFMQLDLLEPGNCLAACEGMDYVFNLLCVKGSPGTATKKAETMLRVNLLLDINLLDAARRCGVEGFLLASSLAVYSPASIFYEDMVWQAGVATEPSPNDYYAGWAKRMGELQAKACRIEYGWERISIVRPTNTYGPYDDFDSPGAMVVPALIRRVVKGENPLRVWGDGSEIRDFLYSEDVARGMILVAKSGEQRPVNLGSGTGVSIRDLVHAILHASGNPPEVAWDESKKAGDKIRVLNTDRARSLGFVPAFTLEEGIAETMSWYEHRGGNSGRYEFFKHQ